MRKNYFLKKYFLDNFLKKLLANNKNTIKSEQSLTELEDICLICSKTQSNHSSEQWATCSRKLIELGIMRYCEFCGLTKPARGMHDRCGKCDEKYPFSND
mgnify:CR=1 FL=1